MEPHETRPVIVGSLHYYNGASFEVVDVPKGLVVDDLYQEYKLWYKDWRKDSDPVKFLQFSEWLIKQKGFSKSSIEEYWE